MINDKTRRRQNQSPQTKKNKNKSNNTKRSKTDVPYGEDQHPRRRERSSWRPWRASKRQEFPPDDTLLTGSDSSSRSRLSARSNRIFRDDPETSSRGYDRSW